MHCKYLLFALAAVAILSNDCLARGGFSSGGRGGFSSGRSYSGSRSYSPSSRSYPGSRSIVSTRRYYGGGGYYGGVYHHYYGMGSYWGGGYWNPFMFGSFGMGYGYSNGIIDGIILGSLMHPAGTTVYNGGGYSGNALLYPDGRVVDQSGYQVGNYQNNQFMPVQNGGFVAQQAPAQYGGPALQGQQIPQNAQMQGQPVVIQNGSNSDTDAICLIGGGILITVLILFIVGAML